MKYQAAKCDETEKCYLGPDVVGVAGVSTVHHHFVCVQEKRLPKNAVPSEDLITS